MEQKLTNSTKEIKGTRDSSVPPESDEAFGDLSVFLGLANALKVDHANVELPELVQERHVVVLRLDRVRKEEVSLVGSQVGDWHLFDAEDD